MVAQQKKSGWFFNKNIIDEINSVPEEKVETETQSQTQAPTPTQAKPAPALKMVSDNTVPELSEKQTEEVKELKRLIFEKNKFYRSIKKKCRPKINS